MQFEITQEALERIARAEIAKQVEQKLENVDFSIQREIDIKFAQVYSEKRDYYSKPEVKREIILKLEKDAKDMIVPAFERIWQEMADKNIKYTVREYVRKKAEEMIESCKAGMGVSFADEMNEMINDAASQN